MFEFQPELVGEFVRMRPFQAEDFAALYALAADPLLWQPHPEPERGTEAGFRAYFDAELASGGALAATDKVDGTMIGMIRYSVAAAEPGEVEIGGAFIGRKYWGGHHSRDIKRTMLAHAFRFMDAVIFRTGERNLRARRDVEKMSARLDGRELMTTFGTRTVLFVFYRLDWATFEQRRAAEG